MRPADLGPILATVDRIAVANRETGIAPVTLGIEIGAIPAARLERVARVAGEGIVSRRARQLSLLGTRMIPLLSTRFRRCRSRCARPGPSAPRAEGLTAPTGPAGSHDPSHCS
jgi:hypothetical protein